ncbi:50S ribosomal protein L4 [Patescibacteria group bacterium]|nr:MAG: 50S ribosomal protein L4 [Patescibacteria group bacterium]
MAKVTLYNQEGAKVGELALDPALFEVKANPALVHEAVVAQTANSRVVTAHTKDRGEVAGTGKKPWKQKGTGRARHGSRRSPIWVGGGVTFGPTSERNFSVKMNRAARRKALAMVLSDKVAGERLVAVDSLALPEAKTKRVAFMLAKLPLAGSKTLIVVEAENRGVARAAKNLPRVSTISVGSLNVVDLLSHETIVASKAALEALVKTYKRA